jgi:hypothetical protein
MSDQKHSKTGDDDAKHQDSKDKDSKNQDAHDRKGVQDPKQNVDKPGVKEPREPDEYEETLRRGKQKK